MIKLNKHGMISKRLIAPEFTVGNTFVEGGGTPEELAVLSLTNEQLAALSYIVNGEGRIIPVGEDGTFDTKIGHSYCIRHTDDLTLHEAWLSNDENLYVKRYGSGQLLFFATSEKCKINNPSYIVTEVFRMAALNEFVDWSGISTTQAWFKKIEVELTELLGSKDKFVLEIADGNTLVVHTDRISDDLLPVVKATTEVTMPEGTTLVQYNHHMEISWRDINKYAACKTFDDMMVVDPEKNVKRSSNDIETFDLTSTGEWHYPLPEFQRILKEGALIQSFLKNVKNETLTLNLPKLIDVSSLCAGLKYVKHVSLTAPAASNMSFPSYPTGSKFESFSCCAPNGKYFHWAFYDNTNLKNFYIESINEKATDFENIFYKCQLNRDSVIDFCNKLPICTTNNQKVTLGIHVDHKYDPDVNLALKKIDINYTATVELPEEVTEGKGYILTVQWNGTSTSAASTMTMGQLIYAKVGEHELHDGTIEQYLDWGHYVTDETGYDTFRSLESAYKYFGLEMPQMNED